MKEQNQTMKVLLLIIILLVVILVLKMTNIIKPSEKVVVNSTNIVEESNVIIEEQTNNEMNEEKSNNLFNFIAIFGTASIVIQILSVIVWIGEGRLYKKIGMPYWTIILAYIYPFVVIISQQLPKVLGNLIEGIVGILMLISLCNYFKTIGMSKWWPVLLLVALGILLYSVSSIISISMTNALLSSIGETEKTPMSAIIFSILGGLGVLMFIIQYAISNYRLAEHFEKGTGFKIGIVILPFIFRPILGFQSR